MQVFASYSGLGNKFSSFPFELRLSCVATFPHFEKRRKEFMAFCAKCGAQLNNGAAFCPACGAAASAATTTTSGAAAAPAPAATSTGMANNVAGMLCYLVGWITGLIFLLIEPYKNDRVVRFHAFQSIFFNVGMIAVWIAFTLVAGILGVVTKGLSIIITGPLFFVVWLGFIACWIFLMVKAYNNQQFKLPIIGDLAAKQAGL
jgi:uncharacterized membrane protein